MASGVWFMALLAVSGGLILRWIESAYRRLAVGAIAISPGPIAIVIAHPDDESMFFIPSVIAQYPRKVHLLCLSNGNNVGLGRIRSSELQSAASILGMTTVEVVDDNRLPDQMTNDWPLDVIQDHVRSFVERHEIESIMTFDDYGVSGHINHISVHRAIRAMDHGLAVWALDSVPLWRKYLGPINILMEIVNGTGAHQVVYISADPLLSYRAMSAHASQLVWFRYLFIFLSSYTFVNRLHRLPTPSRSSAPLQS